MTDEPYRLINGECVEAMNEMEGASVEAVICDPPYGIALGGLDWDSFGGGRQGSEAFEEWTHSWAAQAIDLLKPGGHLLAFGAPRMYHRLACGIEDAGFEIRDSVLWIYGSGFARSMKFEGWASRMKPAHEPVVVARRPLDGTLTENVARHGVGAVGVVAAQAADGREPANVALSHLPDCKGSGVEYAEVLCAPGCPVAELETVRQGAARFFYVAKPRRRERTAGALENEHETVKPVELMRWLIRLVTPPGGTVLDPFMGSGTTGCAAMAEGMRFVGIEREWSHFETARSRIADWALAHGRDVTPRTGDRQ